MHPAMVSISIQRAYSLFPLEKTRFVSWTWSLIAAAEMANPGVCSFPKC
jgi:hypothetical protein